MRYLELNLLSLSSLYLVGSSCSLWYSLSWQANNKQNANNMPITSVSSRSIRHLCYCRVFRFCVSVLWVFAVYMSSHWWSLKVHVAVSNTSTYLLRSPFQSKSTAKRQTSCQLRSAWQCASVKGFESYKKTYMGSTSSLCMYGIQYRFSLPVKFQL